MSFRGHVASSECMEDGFSPLFTEEQPAAWVWTVGRVSRTEAGMGGIPKESPWPGKRLTVHRG